MLVQIFVLHALFRTSAAVLSWEAINSPLAQQRLHQLMEVAGPLECVDAIVDDLCEQYPELCPSTEEEIVTLKEEYQQYLLGVFLGNSANFRAIAAKITHLKRIAKREMAKLQGKERGAYEDADHFIASHVFTSMVRLHQRRTAQYVRLGYSPQLIRKEIEKRQIELWETWHELENESPHDFCKIDEFFSCSNADV